MNYFFQLAFLLVMTLTFSCQGDKTEAQKFDTTNKKNVVVKTTNDRVLGVARIEPQEGIINLVAGASGKILDVIRRQYDHSKRANLAVAGPICRKQSVTTGKK